MAPTSASTDIATTATDLYRVFQPYRLGPDFSGCECCVEPRETLRLANTPLRELTLQDLDSYSFKAITTWGDTRHFKHFLPRLFELATADPEGFLSLEVLLSKLDYGKWEEWLDFEQKAVDRFLQALWATELARDVEYEGDDRVDMILCGLGRAYSNLNLFLAVWTSTDSASACRQLSQYFLVNYDELAGHGKLANALWDGRNAQVSQVVAWLRSPVVYEYLVDRQGHLDDRLKMAVPLMADWQSERQRRHASRIRCQEP